MSDNARHAAEYFLSGLYCSQAVLGAFCEGYGLDKGAAFSIACGFGSGARCSELCGAVSGAIMVIGLKFGDDQKMCNAETEAFVESFKDANKSVICRDILGCDISTPDGRQIAVDSNLFRTRCVDIVKCAAQILADSGY